MGGTWDIHRRVQASSDHDAYSKRPLVWAEFLSFFFLYRLRLHSCSSTRKCRRVNTRDECECVWSSGFRRRVLSTWEYLFSSLGDEGTWDSLQKRGRREKMCQRNGSLREAQEAGWAAWDADVLFRFFSCFIRANHSYIRLSVRVHCAIISAKNLPLVSPRIGTYTYLWQRH